MSNPQSTPPSRNTNANLLLAFGVICVLVGAYLVTEHSEEPGGPFIIAAAIAFGAAYIGSRPAIK